MTKLHILFLFILSLSAQVKPFVPEIGVVQDFENDSQHKLTFGFRCLVESTSKMPSPRNVNDKQFEAGYRIITISFCLSNPYHPISQKSSARMSCLPF